MLVDSLRMRATMTMLREQVTRPGMSNLDAELSAMMDCEEVGGTGEYPQPQGF